MNTKPQAEINKFSVAAHSTVSPLLHALSNHGSWVRKSIESVTQPLTICSLFDTVVTKPMGRLPADNWSACITQKQHTGCSLAYLFCNLTALRPRASRHKQQHRQLTANNCHLWVIHALHDCNNEVDEWAGEDNASRVPTHRLSASQQVGYGRRLSSLGSFISTSVCLK